MMRIDNLMQRAGALCAFVLAAILGSAACNEADGTEPWPGAYPPEAEIDRPKGGVDAGRADAGGETDAETDAETEEDAELDAGADADADATPDAPDASDGAAAADATADATADAG